MYLQSASNVVVRRHHWRRLGGLICQIFRLLGFPTLSTASCLNATYVISPSLKGLGRRPAVGLLVVRSTGAILFLILGTNRFILPNPTSYMKNITDPKAAEFDVLSTSRSGFLHIWRKTGRSATSASKLLGSCWRRCCTETQMNDAAEIAE